MIQVPIDYLRFISNQIRHPSARALRLTTSRVCRNTCMHTSKQTQKKRSLKRAHTCVHVHGPGPPCTTFNWISGSSEFQKEGPNSIACSRSSECFRLQLGLYRAKPIFHAPPWKGLQVARIRVPSKRLNPDALEAFELHGRAKPNACETQT